MELKQMFLTPSNYKKIMTKGKNEDFGLIAKEYATEVVMQSFGVYKPEVKAFSLAHGIEFEPQAIERFELANLVQVSKPILPPGWKKFPRNARPAWPGGPGQKGWPPAHGAVGPPRAFSFQRHPTRTAGRCPLKPGPLRKCSTPAGREPVFAGRCRRPSADCGG